MLIKSTTTNKEYQSKSAMIKDLRFNQKMSVGEISKQEGILYQHVRNVCVNHENDELLRTYKAGLEKKD